jgi:nuclear pore complex protein Nup107
MSFAMLRRGLSWEQVRDWCEERREGWRAVSFGMAADTQMSTTGLGGPQAGLLWRQMCLAAARHSGYDIYQRAVYGLLAGDINSVDPACRSFDDLLYTRYNALLIRSFEDWLCKAFPDMFTALLHQKFPGLTSAVSEEELEMEPSDYIFKVVNHPSCVQEGSEPMKVLQASIIGDDFQRLITNLGIILAHKANPDGQRSSRLLPPMEGLTFQERYACLAEDFDVIRMVVHIFAIYEYTGYEFPDPFRFEVIEYVIIAYIDYLRIQRKIEAIPTYSALLSNQRKHSTLGVVLVDITDVGEQKELIGLIKQQDVNLARVITEQYLYAADLMDLMSGDDWRPVERFNVLEETDDPRWPGYRIKRDFKPEPLSFEEDRLVRSVEWYLHVDSMWKETFYGMAFAMRGLLLSGMFNGALEITKRVAYKAVSLAKTPQYLGRSVDVFEEEAEMVSEEPGSLPRRSTRASSRQLSEAPVREAPSEEDRFRLNMLRSQARQYREMQQLTLAMEQIAFCKDFEEIIISKTAM